MRKRYSKAIGVLAFIAVMGMLVGVGNANYTPIENFIDNYGLTAVSPDEVWTASDCCDTVSVTLLELSGMYIKVAGIDNNGQLSGLLQLSSESQTGEIQVSSLPATFLWAIEVSFENPSYTNMEEYYTSDPADNIDGLGTAWDQMLTYQGSDADGDFYMLFWEDTLPDDPNSWGGDRNFTDAVLQVRCAEPVPIPAGFILLGSGLIALAGIRKRHQR